MTEFAALLDESGVSAEVSEWLVREGFQVDNFAIIAPDALSIRDGAKVYTELSKRRLPPALFLGDRTQRITPVQRTQVKNELTKVLQAWVYARHLSALPMSVRRLRTALTQQSLLRHSRANCFDPKQILWIFRVFVFGSGPGRLPACYQVVQRRWSPGLVPRALLMGVGLSCFVQGLGSLALGTRRACRILWTWLDRGGWRSRVCTALACWWTFFLTRYGSTFFFGLSSANIRSQFWTLWSDDVHALFGLRPRYARLFLMMQVDLPIIFVSLVEFWQGETRWFTRGLVGSALTGSAFLLDSLVARWQADHSVEPDISDIMPPYWDITGRTNVEVSTSAWQVLVDETWVAEPNKARDRSAVQPRMLHVKDAYRIQNPSLWQRYYTAREGVSKEEAPGYASLQTDALLPPMLTGTLDANANEHMLFHGTSVQGAEAICLHGFKISKAGSAAGAAFGEGCYFAENSSKSEQYAKEAEGIVSRGRCAIFVCRVAMGSFEQVTEPKGGTSGPTRLVDRGLVTGQQTYREVVLFDERCVYPEWLLVCDKDDGKHISPTTPTLVNPLPPTAHLGSSGAASSESGVILPTATAGRGRLQFGARIREGLAAFSRPR